MEKHQVMVRLSAEEFNELDDICHIRRVKKQAALLEAIEMWKNHGSVATPRPMAVPTAVAGATKEEQALAAQFLEFLREGDAGQVDMVKFALEAHAKKKRTLRKRSSA